MSARNCGRITLGSLALSLVFLFGAWAGVRSNPDVNYFGPARASQVPLVDRMRAVEVREIKLSHANNMPRFNVGLFGNSRALSVSAEHLGLEQDQFFNFAVPGTSIRNSISMLERLENDNRVPRTAILGLDNFYLEYFENSEANLFPERLLLVMRDTGRMLTGKTAFVDGGKMLWRHLHKAWVSFEDWIAFAAFRQRSLGKTSASLYRPDGSRIQTVRTGREFQLELAPREPSFLLSVLRQDLARLRAMAKTGTSRIVVVETPLHARSVLTGTRARGLREFFLAECRALELECYSLAGADLPSGDASWPDATHAPASAFGKALARIYQSPPRPE